MATVVGLGLSGIPYSGPDIGGFQGNPSAELYLRWFQLATFHTFYRSHCSNNVDYRAPWTYGEPYLSMIRQMLKLRYRLLPYFYTLSWEANQKGYPPVRPFFWLDSSDSALWDVEDAFLLGDDLMVCPILEDGARQRQVTLPKGRWYSFWNNAVFDGAGQVNVDAPLEQIPLLVRAGTILPMEEGQQLILHIYPPVEGSCESFLYSDAQDGYGESRIDKFCLVRDGNSLEMTWEEQGEYPFPYGNVQLHLHGMKLQQVWVDDGEVGYQGQPVEVKRFQKVRFQGELA